MDYAVRKTSCLLLAFVLLAGMVSALDFNISPGETSITLQRGESTLSSVRITNTDQVSLNCRTLLDGSVTDRITGIQPEESSVSTFSITAPSTGQGTIDYELSVVCDNGSDREDSQKFTLTVQYPSSQTLTIEKNARFNISRAEELLKNARLKIREIENVLESQKKQDFETEKYEQRIRDIKRDIASAETSLSQAKRDMPENPYSGIENAEKSQSASRSALANIDRLKDDLREEIDFEKEASRLEARRKIDAARSDLTKARGKVVPAEENIQKAKTLGWETSFEESRLSTSRDLIKDTKMLLDRANIAMSSGNYTKARNIAEKAHIRAEDALDISRKTYNSLKLSEISKDQAQKALRSTRTKLEDLRNLSSSLEYMISRFPAKTSEKENLQGLIGTIESEVSQASNTLSAIEEDIRNERSEESLGTLISLNQDLDQFRNKLESDFSSHRNSIENSLSSKIQIRRSELEEVRKDISEASNSISYSEETIEKARNFLNDAEQNISNSISLTESLNEGEDVSTYIGRYKKSFESLNKSSRAITRAKRLVEEEGGYTSIIIIILISLLVALAALFWVYTALSKTKEDETEYDYQERQEEEKKLFGIFKEE